MKNHLFAAPFSFLLLCSPAACRAGPEAPSDLPEEAGAYVLTFQDEFSGTQLDASKWRPRSLGRRRLGIVVEEASRLNGEGQLFLQKRSLHKDIQPGKWDTSVGGHVDLGEVLIVPERETRIAVSLVPRR